MIYEAQYINDESSNCHCPTQIVSGVAYGLLCYRVGDGLSLSLWETVGEISDYTLVFYFIVNIIVFCQAAIELKHLLELAVHLSPILGKHIKKDDIKLPLLKLQSAPSEHFKVAYPEELTEVSELEECVLSQGHSLDDGQKSHPVTSEQM